MSIYLKYNSPSVPNPTVESTSITVIPAPTSPITLVLGGVTKVPYVEPSTLESLLKPASILNL